MVIQRNMTSTKPPMVQTRCIHTENLTLALEQESVSGWVCGVTSCGLFAFLSLSQRLITHKIIKHTCANTHVPLIRSGLLCRHYSPQVLTRAETISTYQQTHFRVESHQTHAHREAEQHGWRGGRREIRSWFGAHGGTLDSAERVSEKLKIWVDSICSALLRWCFTCVHPSAFVSPTTIFYFSSSMLVFTVTASAQKTCQEKQIKGPVKWHY